MHFQDIERMMVSAEKAFAKDLLAIEELLGHPHPRHRHWGKKDPGRLVFTTLFIHNQKIGGFIMDFTLSKDTPSVQLLLQDLDENGAILPDIDTVTGHPTLQPGTLKITGDANIVVVQDPTNPALVTVSRASNTSNGVSMLNAAALNDDAQTIEGASKVTVISDPVVDNGIAKSLQFVPAPVAPAAAAQPAS